jgi:hypothetical protein
LQYQFMANLPFINNSMNIKLYLAPRIHIFTRIEFGVINIDFPAINENRT